MGKRSKKRHSRDTDSDSEDSDSPLTSPSESESEDSNRPSKRRRHRHRKERSSSRREKDRSSKQMKKKRTERDRDRKRRKSNREEKRKSKRRDYSTEDDESKSSGCSDSKPEQVRASTESVVRDMLTEFPKVADDLKQLLKMLDNGQAVDVNGISERVLIRHLKKLFISLNLKEKSGVFLLPSDGDSVFEIVGPLIDAQSVTDSETVAIDAEGGPSIHDNNAASVVGNEEPSAQRRVIGPEMPSAELLAAAAKLTEAQAELRDAELEEDDEFIGPAPPAMVAEAESVNEAERFEEVTRIMGAEEENPYDVVGANHKMSTDNIKKRYWKLSLLVHPDKCSHPHAQQAFVKLNKAFKDLQDPDKRKAFDDKIKVKEEQEAFKAELRSMREAAQWRKLQGISMEGDEELLAEVTVNVPPKRDEWMTALPPERKPGMTMQSSKFSNTTKEGRGDTSMWTDTPSERAQKAKMNYLEAYNEAAALMSNEVEKKMSKDAELVDMYNKAKRSKSLVQKHREESSRSSRLKKKSKQPEEIEKGEWAGNHPWKPWDREKDLEAGRQKVKLDSEGMAQGLTSRFLSGNFQRSFL